MAREFPGVNGCYLNVGDVAAVDIVGTAITLAAWIRPDVVNANKAIIQKRDAGGNTNQYQLVAISTGFLRFRVNDVGAQIDGATLLSAGVWQHVAGRLDGTAQTVWLNGSQVGSGTAGASIPDTASSFRLGSEDSFQSAFDGLIAEVGLWNVALSDGELAALGKGVSPLLIRPLSLKGYWPLDRALYVGAEPDQSPNRNPASIVVVGGASGADGPPPADLRPVTKLNVADSSNLQTYVTGSVTIEKDKLYLLHIWGGHTSAPGTPTVTGLSQTWTPATNVDRPAAATPFRSLTYLVQPSSTQTGTISIDWGQVINSAGWQLIELPAAASSPVVQSGATGAAGATTNSHTLSALESPRNLIVGVLAVGAGASAETAGSGFWKFLSAAGEHVRGSIEIGHDDNSVDWSWTTSLHSVVHAHEIRAGAAPTRPPIARSC